MKTNTLLIPAALLTAVALSSAPALAQQRDHERGNRSQDENRSSERAVPRGWSAPAQSQPQRQAAPQFQPQPQRQAAPQFQAQPQRQAAPQFQAQPQRQAVPQFQAQPQRQAAPQFQAQPQRQAAPQRQIEQPRRETAMPRIESPRYAPRYEPRYEPRHESRGYRNDRPTIIAPRYNGYGYGYAPRYDRPYLFRPRLSIGFGIFAGFPVPYSYSYPYPIPVYGYSAPRGEVIVGPGSNQYGGVSLEISPSDAQVYVDGTYAGEVRDFDGTQQPLTLAYGAHRIDVQAPGYETLTFDVAVQAGQVIPYRGDLQPMR